MADDTVNIEVSGPEDGPLHNVLTPFETSGPGSLLVELTQNRDRIDSLVVIARDKNGRLYVTWTEQAQSELAEAAKLLDTTVGFELFQDHSYSDEDSEYPGLSLSNIFSIFQDEDEEEIE